MTILFVYDDTSVVPESIRRIIGVAHFGDIMRHKRRLADTIKAGGEGAPECVFTRVHDAREAQEVCDRIERMPASAMIFRLPSSLVPLWDRFPALIAKLPFALDPVFYGSIAQLGDAPTLLPRDEALAVLRETDPAERCKLLYAFEQQAVYVDAVPFLDIAQISHFLTFMAGATEARHFNVTRHTQGVFRKWSSDVAKIRGEYRYFHIAEEGMKRFLLPTFDYAEENGGAAYSMEYMSVPDAAMQIQHNTFNEQSFAQLLDHFFAFVKARGRVTATASEVRDVARRDIVDKLDRRIDALRHLPNGKRLEALLAIAGPHGTLSALVERCKALLLRAINASQIDYLALGHGDPCFSNILYNAEINLFRLIDPRGTDTQEQAFMHPVYDLAKLSHSVLGGYDFVNGGLAECRIDGSLRLDLTMDQGGPPAWMMQAFRARLAAEGWDEALVRAIEASLFLSMLPLHCDSTEKLPAFCLIAGNIIEQLENRRD
jgi:hypothetical protein